MLLFRKACLLVAGSAAILATALSARGNETWSAAAAIAALAAAGGLGAVPALVGYQFTLWIVAVVGAAMLRPAWFLSVGPLNVLGVEIPGVDLRAPALLQGIVQLVMFGMGTKMSLQDFAGVAKMPRPVLIGLALQFSVMPLTGFALATAFGFEPEIAAGVVLIGSCSSGLASNVMCYLAGANLPLSITLTALATLLAPVMTPFWMRTLAGAVVERSFLEMMVDIVKMTIVPIGAAMIHNYLTTASPAAWRRTLLAAAIAAVAFVLVRTVAAANLADPSAPFPMPTTLASYLLAAPVAGVAYHFLAAMAPAIDRRIHLASMAGIIYFTAVTTAAGRDNLLVAGLALCAAAVLHNLVGYAAGYGFSRIAGLDRESALTVGFEVGMQNGGMAAGLASAMGKLSTLGLAAAVFSPWMNVSGSLWANHLRRRRSEARAGDDAASDAALPLPTASVPPDSV
ncbi:MAG: bile acid:sodium symporter family protein [Pirellulales bacterium]|nr:bile acid:sodium symporter family protein [Pirellulales bacterium]